MGDTRAILRLGLAPALLLAWNLWTDDTLPYLGAMLAVTLLMPGGPRPPLKQLLGAIVLVSGLAWALAGLFGLVADSPGSVWMALLALSTLCFGVLGAKPDNVPATLALLTAVVVTALIQADPSLTTTLAAVMTRAAAEAVGTVLLAHAALPSRGPAAPRPQPPAPPAMPGLRAFLKALAMVVALALLTAAGQASGVLVAITLSNLLRSADEAGAHRFGRGLVLGNLAAAALMLPMLLVAMLRPEPMILLPQALAVSLWLASGLGRPGWRGVLAQMGLPVFLLLLGQMLPGASVDSLAALWDRLFFLTIALAWGWAVLVLLRPRDVWGVTAGESSR